MVTSGETNDTLMSRRCDVLHFARWSYGADTWIERDVIIVAPNHRLGTLGFTSLGIPEAPGNQVIGSVKGNMRLRNT